MAEPEPAAAEDIDEFGSYRQRQERRQVRPPGELKEIRDNEFNLNIPRYVDTFEAEVDVDLVAVQAEIREIDTGLGTVEQELERYLKELGFDD